jgi:hypothetical protein
MKLQTDHLLNIRIDYFGDDCGCSFPNQYTHLLDPFAMGGPDDYVFGRGRFIPYSNATFVGTQNICREMHVPVRVC